MRGVNHYAEISYTLARNPIVFKEISRKSYCFIRNLVRSRDEYLPLAYMQKYLLDGFICDKERLYNHP